jgi:hypothetical protein
MMKLRAQYSQSSLPGLTRQSIPLRKKMDARIKSAHDAQAMN